MGSVAMDEKKGALRVNRRTNCQNCGAPLNNGHCDYCGTQNWTEAQSFIEVNASGIRFGVIAPENYNRCDIERGCYV